jgi:two-component system, OmpR family, sensor histidine kinase MprB
VTWSGAPSRLRLSLRARVALLVAGAVGIAIAVAALATFVALRAQLSRQTDAALVDRARHAAQLDPRGLLGATSVALGAADIRIAFLTEGRELVVGRGLPVGPSELAVATGDSTQSLRTVTLDGTRYRLVAVPYGQGGAVLIAESLAENEAVQHTVGIVLLVVGLVGVVAAAAVGLAVARAGLRPVKRLTAAAEHVAATQDLSAAIEVRGDDELARLASSFNAMLAALEASRRQQRQLVADASHELRTPLTSLRTNLDLLAQTTRSDAGPQLSPADREALLSDVRSQLEELSALVSDLVQLAYEDTVEPTETRESVELAEVVERAVERVRRRAGGVQITTDLQSWTVDGEPRSLERAVTNLLDNAVKWSPPGGRVRVTLRGGEITVRDEGPGIAAADLPHVFERFYRATSARSMPGSGLGLAIVRQVAQAHGGDVHAERAAGGGTRVELTLADSANGRTPRVLDAS